jgi:L-ascorbate metabolism protein UlaG (beta-lactamase superfamily)
MSAGRTAGVGIALLLVAVASAARADTIRAVDGDITITPLIHSSFQIEHAGTVIQVDPWSAGDLSAAKPADLILVTDDVPHHLDVAAIARLRRPGARVIMPASGKTKLLDGTVLANGETTTAAGVTIEAMPAYDIKPGEPSHPKGRANGYLITVAGRRILVAGVTECVAEIRALKDIDVAFVPVNLPLERMAPATAAECVAAFRPHIVYPYHYDQAYAARAANPRAAESPADAAKAREQVEAFKDALAPDRDIEVRIGAWYPPRRAATPAASLAPPPSPASAP